ncbi:type 4a pilus biogenesis protein PilO [Candidatus Parcubacteria bacterium]|nr:type 4a pilus biogenesis protein PilO [Candidatus Parcubacteria bacterium]
MQINKPISIIIMFVITLVVAFLFAIPAYEESLALKNTLAQKQSEYTGKSEYYAKVNELTSKIESNSVAIEKISSALPDDFYLSSLVYFLQKKASDAGLVAKLISFSKVSPKTADKKPRIGTFSVNVSGNYQGLKNFLESLDKSSRLFEVNSISFSSQQNSQKTNQLKNQAQIYDFNLQLETQAY